MTSIESASPAPQAQVPARDLPRLASFRGHLAHRSRHAIPSTASGRVESVEVEATAVLSRHEVVATGVNADIAGRSPDPHRLPFVVNRWPTPSLNGKASARAEAVVASVLRVREVADPKCRWAGAGRPRWIVESPRSALPGSPCLGR